MPLSPASATTFRGIIDQSLAPAPAATAAAAVPINFCGLWPEAKPILQALVSVVSVIPGAGKTAGQILASLIQVGDTVYQQTCQASAATVAASAHSEARSIIEASLAGPAAPAAPAAVSVNFCTVWPEAKPILQFVSGIVAFIPGVGAAAGPILTALIAVGDSIFQQTCHGG